MMVNRVFKFTFVLITLNFLPAQISETKETSAGKISEFKLESAIGQSIRLNCTGDDDSVTYWKFNGELLITQGSLTVENKDGLFIPSTTEENLGTYVCYDGFADEPLLKYVVKLKGYKKPFNDSASEEDHDTNNVLKENKDTVTDDVISSDISSETIEEQLLNRLQLLESNSLVMQTTVEDRLRHMEKILVSLLRSLGNPKVSQNSLQRSAAVQSEPVADQRVINGDFVSEYTWIIPNMENETERAESDGSYNLQSPYFYTHRPGYRMRLLFYPNYRNTNASGLFAGLVQGEYDDLLPWPFPHNYQLMILSHKPNVMDDVANIRLTITNCNPEVFQRPRSENPPACGFREFISHAKLQRHKRAFLIYGNLVIKIRLFISN